MVKAGSFKQSECVTDMSSRNFTQVMTNFNPSKILNSNILPQQTNQIVSITVTIMLISGKIKKRFCYALSSQCMFGYPG